VPSITRTVAHPHHPGVAVVVASTVIRDPAAIPDHDHGVAIGVDRADANRAKPLAGGEPSSEPREDSSTNYCRVPYSFDAVERPSIRHTISGAERSVMHPLRLARPRRRRALSSDWLPWWRARALCPGCAAALAQAKRGRRRSSHAPCWTWRLLSSSGKSGPTWIAGNRIAAEPSLLASVYGRLDRLMGGGPSGAPAPRPESNDQARSSESSIRFPNGSAKNASLRLMAGNTHGSATISDPSPSRTPLAAATRSAPHAPRAGALPTPAASAPDTRNSYITTAAYHSRQDDLRPLDDLVEAEMRRPTAASPSHLTLRLTEAGEGVALKKCPR
jgi:hypothetical protein